MKSLLYFNFFSVFVCILYEESSFLASVLKKISTAAILQWRERLQTKLVMLKVFIFKSSVFTLW